MTGPLSLSFKKCFLNTQVSITIICLPVILLSQSGIPWKEEVVQLVTQRTSAFPQDSPCTHKVSTQHRGFVRAAHLATQVLKRGVLEDWDWTTLRIVVVFTMNTLKWNGHLEFYLFIYLSTYLLIENVNNIMAIFTIWCDDLHYILSHQQFYPPLLLYHWCKC